MTSQGKTYTIRLTREELWSLSQGFEASFTDPSMMSDVDKRVAEKIGDLHCRAHREKDLQK